MKYQKKAVSIEAVQFIDTPERISEIAEFIGGDIRVNYEDKDNPYILIETLEGTMKANVGDYIIKGVRGEFYPCERSIFEETYRCVETPLDRMKLEIDELVDKFHKLDVFMKSDKFLSLSPDIARLLEIQYEAMAAYIHALQLRAAKMSKK